LIAPVHGGGEVEAHVVGALESLRSCGVLLHIGLIYISESMILGESLLASVVGVLSEYFLLLVLFESRGCEGLVDFSR